MSIKYDGISPIHIYSNTAVSKAKSISAIHNGAKRFFDKKYNHKNTLAKITASIITTIPNGSRVDVIGQSGNFFQIRFGGRTGFASRDFIRLT